MANGEKSRRHWVMAVTASLVLHGAILLGLGLVAGRTDVAVRSAPKPQFMPYTFVDGSGAVTFEEAHAPRIFSSRPKKPLNAPKHDAAPATALLRDPWTVVAANDGNAEASQVGGSGRNQDASKDGTASFFKVPARGRRIVYVVDVSASMGTHGALAVACHELTASLRGLPGGVRFQVVIYNSHARHLLPRFDGWLEPTPTIIEEACAALTRQVAEGSTNHEPALRLALQLRPDVVFFLTDADDLTPDQVRMVQALNRGHAIIHTIELTVRNRDRTGMPLQVLARENRGIYQAVDLEH